MINPLTKLKWWFYRKQNDLLPCPDELRSLQPLKSVQNPQVYRIMVQYINGMTVEQIASLSDRTRERVRQIILKVYRKSKHVDSNL